MERLEFHDFKVSIKSTSVPNTIASNRLLGEKIDYPLHLGITEAGTKWSGSLKSSVGLGTLLADGIGDTIRISLSTFHAEEEVKVAWEILKALKLRERGPVLIACPTCGRLQFDMDSVVAEIEDAGCAATTTRSRSPSSAARSTGSGRPRHADFGIAGAKDMGIIYSRGEALRKVPTGELVDVLFEEIDKYYAAGKKIVKDEEEAAEGAEWLAKIEAENAGELTPRAHRRDGGRGGRRRGRRPRAGAAAGRGRVARRRAALQQGVGRPGPSQRPTRRRAPSSTR